MSALRSRRWYGRADGGNHSGCLTHGRSCGRHHAVLVSSSSAESVNVPARRRRRHRPRLGRYCHLQLLPCGTSRLSGCATSRARPLRPPSTGTARATSARPHRPTATVGGWSPDNHGPATRRRPGRAQPDRRAMPLGSTASWPRARERRPLLDGRRHVARRCAATAAPGHADHDPGSRCRPPRRRRDGASSQVCLIGCHQHPPPARHGRLKDVGRRFTTAFADTARRRRRSCPVMRATPPSPGAAAAVRPCRLLPGAPFLSALAWD